MMQLIEAFRESKFGMHDVVLAGGAEASILRWYRWFQYPYSTMLEASIHWQRPQWLWWKGTGFLSSEHAQKHWLLAYFGWNGWLRFKLWCLPQRATPPEWFQVRLKQIKLAINELVSNLKMSIMSNTHGASTPANEKGESRLLFLYLVKRSSLYHLLNHTGYFIAAGTVEAIAPSAIRPLYQKLLVPNCLTISKQTLFIKRIFSMLSQIPFYWRTQCCFCA